jgi:hypothetical protein
MVAEVLSGSRPLLDLTSAPIWPGMPISAAECFLEADLMTPAREAVAEFHVWLSTEANQWNDEVARYELMQGEIAARSGDLDAAKGLIEKATQWIVQSGSQEHLCLLHLRRARLAIREKRTDISLQAAEEGIRIAIECDFGFYHYQLRAAEAEALLIEKRAADAARSANAALYGVLKATRTPAVQVEKESDLLVPGAAHPASANLWGAVTGNTLLGRALIGLNDKDGARTALSAAATIQERLQDLRIVQTKALIAASR